MDGPSYRGARPGPGRPTAPGTRKRGKGPTPRTSRLDQLPPVRVPRMVGWTRDNATGELRPRQIDYIRFLAALAHLMSDLDSFWRERSHWELDRVQRLLGFPVIADWAERALSSEARAIALRYQLDSEVGYLRRLPKSSSAVYRRASDRISAEHERQSDACTAVWYPVFGYLVDHPWVYDYLPAVPKPFAPRQLQPAMRQCLSKEKHGAQRR
jgi:hypothetical protein